MTETSGTTPTPADASSPGEPGPHPPPRRWMVVAAVLAAVAVIAVGIAAFAAGRGDDSSPTATEQIAATRRACQQWLDNDTSVPGRGPRADWCDDMAGWMLGHRGSGRMMMGRGGMWASPEAMRDICVQVMGNGPTTEGDATAWCDRMVDWMSSHGGDGDD